MGKDYQYRHKVLIVSDDLLAAAVVLKEMSGIIYVEMIAWEDFKTTDLKRFDIPVFDVDFTEPDNITRLQQIQNGNKNRHRTICSVDRKNRKVVAQANALGIRYNVKKPLDSQHLINVVVSICEKDTNKGCCEKSGDDLDLQVCQKRASEACFAIADLLDRFIVSVRKGDALPMEEVYSSSIQIIEAVENSDMDVWLKAVRAHSSFTYRHVMIVTGYATAFASKYSLSQKEKERLTIGALLHDIGKVKIPQKILDKPGQLTDDEYQKVRRHAEEGARILQRDLSISPEVVMIARSHHEMLDGSGYPDGLKGAEIPDIVRIMTVIDIFSALVEARSYKKSMSPPEAFNILLEMHDKLDQDIVRAFQPIALDREADILVQKINGTAA